MAVDLQQAPAGEQPDQWENHREADGAQGRTADRDERPCEEGARCDGGCLQALDETEDPGQEVGLCAGRCRSVRAATSKVESEPPTSTSINTIPATPGPAAIPSKERIRHPR